MTDQPQTIPAGLTRDQARAVREWAERARAAKVQDEPVAHAARVLLAVLPKRPTLADMTMTERLACKWMQADVEDGETRPVIVNPYWAEGTARALWPGGFMEQIDWERVTPRPDLPRMEWPSDQKADPAPTPALPDGWRLADHKDNGRVIVANPTPSSDGRVYYVLPSAECMGFDWLFCDHSELTYLDTDQEPGQ